MSKLCERPGCSEPGAAEYGMVPEDLLFWIAPLSGTPHNDQNVLCRRHADSMSVPRGWTLDDRSEDTPRLFKPRAVDASDEVARRRRRRTTRTSAESGEQLVIDGTGEIDRPPEAKGVLGDDDVPDAGPDAPWRPSFDHDNDLDGLLEVNSPLLARAFRGQTRG